MSRETEKMFKQLHDYMAQNAPEGMSDEKVESLVNEFIQNYNSHRPDEITEETARTSDDFLELAQDADNEGSALKYARKALKLDPDNLDAEFMVAEIASRDELDLLKKLRLAVRHGEQVMESKGYADEDSIGHYWGITETRPYMRVRSAYMSLMKDLGMFRGAAAECEEMIRLCENDNLASDTHSCICTQFWRMSRKLWSCTKNMTARRKHKCCFRCPFCILSWAIWRKPMIT